MPEFDGFDLSMLRGPVFPATESRNEENRDWIQGYEEGGGGGGRLR